MTGQPPAHYCTACLAEVPGPVVTLATRRDLDDARMLHCDRHALPGDLPLAGAVDAVRARVWDDLDEPKGMDDA